MVLHQLPLGRNAAINAECGNRADENRGVLPAFALGQRYYAPYNYPLDKMNVAASEIETIDKPFALPIFDRVLAEHGFDLKGRGNPDVVSSSNLQTTRIGNTAAIAVCPASTTSPGWLIYKVTAPHGAFEGLSVEVDGRAFVDRKKDPQVCVRVLAGVDEATTEIGEFHDAEDLNSLHRFDLSTIARGKGSILVRIEMHAPTVRPEFLDWCAVYGVRFTQPWPVDLTNLPQRTASVELSRKRNLLVSWRRDAELAIAEAEKADQPSMVQRARDAYAKGAYAQAYRLANQAICAKGP